MRTRPSKSGVIGFCKSVGFALLGLAALGLWLFPAFMYNGIG